MNILLAECEKEPVQHFGAFGQGVRLATSNAESPFQFVDMDPSLPASVTCTSGDSFRLHLKSLWF